MVYIMTLSVFMICLFAITSCGKGFDDMEDKEQAHIREGRYTAFLRSVNPSRLKVSGRVNINVGDGQFWVRIRVEGHTSKVMHSQYLHEGDTCPDQGDDLNKDNIIDVMEGHRKYGDILLPFDASLNSRLRGITEFPYMKKQGFYFYSRAAGIINLMNDLRNSLNYPEAMMRSLGPSEDIDLSRRTVVIYGVHEDASLPRSVRTYGGYPAQHTIPVACGELEWTGESDFEP